LREFLFNPKGLSVKGFSKFDLHTQSKYSFDCITSPARLAEAALKKGFRGIALTDHDSFNGVKEMRVEARKRGLVFVPGMEVTTEKGHVLCLFIQEKINASEFWDVADEVEGQGGIASFAHPFRKRDPDVFLDCVEAANGRTGFDENKAAAAMAEKKKLAFTAGSDSHWTREIGRAFLLADAEDAEGLRKAILKRNCAAFFKESHPWEVKLMHNASRAVKYSQKALRKLGWRG